MRMSGLRSLYSRMVGEFIEALNGAVPEYQRLIAIPSMKEAARHIHTLRGNAATLGAMGLNAYATELEHLCGQGRDAAFYEAQVQPLTEMVEATQQALRQVLESFGNPSRPR